ncbi:hypothetical protein [Pedobacter sp. Leaf170]|uniref:hypothetical protein n=1 Tax=Pedobacter sp. Leaf170 TaxID=2876558 RepID=UPI001E2AF09F|nr:hypothetical protein [Pedobacter sp. Leaf170]
MGVKAKFSKADIKNVGADLLKRIELAVVSRFQYIGETFVTNARLKTKKQGGFGNITGNLRSSIGYIILNNGKTVQDNYEVSGTGTKGVQEAKALIRELKSKFNTGYVLIVVAGMNYAAAVESRGLDVITGSSKIAEEDLKDAIEGLAKKLAKR